MEPDRTDIDNKLSEYREYTELCVKGIKQSRDENSGLWDRQLRDGVWAPTLGTEDLTSTCICLIGIDRWDVRGSELSIDRRKSLNAAAKRLRDHGYGGGLGLLIWANAVNDGDPLAELLKTAGQELDDGHVFARVLTSMEASWLLSGLLHELVRRPEEGTRRLASQVLVDIIERLDGTETGLMPHATLKAPLLHRLRRHVPNFADQVYALQALSFAAIVLDSAPAMERARQLGSRLIELQGPLGQWWWHYDSSAGHIADGFPVYSVHQHAMAPMALMALEAASERHGDRIATSDPIRRSHEWLRQNELGIDMVDRAAATIWRDVEYDAGRIHTQLRHLAAAFRQSRRVSRRQRPSLKLNRETRPYEWAWYLYATAVSDAIVNDRHIV